MKRYLIRHGESETNKRRCWTGWLDVAAFCHPGCLRSMLNEVVGQKLSEKFCCGNGTVAVFTYTNGVWRVHSWINEV